MESIWEYAKDTECFSFIHMIFIIGFPGLLRRNKCKVDGSAKISHSKLEESGAFSVSVAFSHLAFRND